MQHGGLIEATFYLATGETATEGKWAYFSGVETLTLQTDADAAGQAAKAVFAETLATADADRRPDRHVAAIVGGKGIIKTDQVDASNVPVVGQLVYCDNDALFSSAAANNIEVGSCLAGVDGEGLYTIALLVP